MLANPLNDLLSSSDSDSLNNSLQMPILICYSYLSHLSENLSWSITLDLPLPKTLEYYLIFIYTTFQKMTPEIKHVADLIPYTLLFPNSKCGTKNNNNLSYSDINQPIPADLYKKKSLFNLGN